MAPHFRHRKVIINACIEDFSLVFDGSLVEHEVFSEMFEQATADFLVVLVFQALDLLFPLLQSFNVPHFLYVDVLFD